MPPETPSSPPTPPPPFETAEDFAAYVQSRRTAIANVFRRFRLPPDVADDILQDTCVLYLQKADSIHPNAARSWFFAVLRQRCRMYYRAQRPHCEVTEGMLPAVVPAQERWEARHDLARALLRLSPKRRAILVGFHLLGYQDAEFAEQSGYAVGSLVRARRRAMRELRRSFTVLPAPRTPRTAAPVFDSVADRGVAFLRMKKKRGPGRPRTRRPDMQMFNASMTPEAKARLKALAEVEGQHAYELLEIAFWNTWKALPAETRQKAEALAGSIEQSLREEAERLEGTFNPAAK